MALIRQEPFSRLLSWGGVEEVPGGVDGLDPSDAADLHSGILTGSGIESRRFRHPSVPGPEPGSASDATTLEATPLPPLSLSSGRCIRSWSIGTGLRPSWWVPIARSFTLTEQPGFRTGRTLPKQAPDPDPRSARPAGQPR
ncbi:hypothetical protein GCM10010505_07910 [Kitasatospora aburaviensis]